MQPPISRSTGQPYTLIGEVHWLIVQDMQFRQYGDLWHIPLIKDMQYGYKRVMIPLNSGKCYYIVTFDLDYLLERFRREYYQALQWTYPELTGFYERFREYLANSKSIQLDYELRKQASNLSSFLNMSADDCYQMLLRAKKENQQSEE